ncbi:TIGR02391 family protein [Arthrobacter sp. D2-10]
MSAVKHPPFPAGTLEHVCKLIAELYSGSELTRIMAEIPLRSDPGEGNTKWRRLAHSVSSNQTRTQNGNALIALITTSMRPERILDRADAAQQTRDQLNQALSLVALKVRDDGRVAHTARAKTVDEAEARTEHLRVMLQRRGAHPEVLAYCRPELMRSDYYEAVFEAIKGLGSRLRQMTGVDGDGYGLVEAAMAGSTPRLRLNSLRTRTQRDEQLGVANLAKGLFSAFRNPAAHEPRIEWSLSEQDALDVLGTLSVIHRRLDAATITTH